MTKHDTERVNRLLFADLTYDDKVDEKYGPKSHRRITELKARLLKAKRDQENPRKAAS